MVGKPRLTILFALSLYGMQMIPTKSPRPAVITYNILTGTFAELNRIKKIEIDA